MDFSESNDFEFDRRHAIAGAIATMTMGPNLSGCVIGLLRLFVGRGLAGTLLRTARVGRAASTLTFGRGVAIGGRAVPATLYRPTSGMIIGPRQQVVATFDTSTANSVVKHKRSTIFSSEKTRYGYEHFDRNGICGRSFSRSGQSEIRHESDDGILLAIDKLNEATGIVEHLDPNGHRIGTSRYTLRGKEGMDILADESSLRSVEIVSRELGLECPDSKRAYDEWLEAKRLCGLNDDAACLSVTDKRIAHETLSKQCRL